MKKFLVLGLVLFGFSTLFAGHTASSDMTYNDAVAYCESKGMTLASVDQLKSWKGSDKAFWANGGVLVWPLDGRELYSFPTNQKKGVRCE